MLVNDWLSAVDRNETEETVLSDLSNALVLIDHRLLPEKLKLYQFSDGSLPWFSSYFHKRFQQVSISGKFQVQG